MINTKRIKIFGLVLLLNVLFQHQGFSVIVQDDLSELELNAILNDNDAQDTAKAAAYLLLSESLFISNFDTLIPLCIKAEELSLKGLNSNPSAAEKRSFLITLSGSYNNQGYAHSEMGDSEKALAFYSKALSIQKNIHDWSGIAISFNNIGYIYQMQGLVKEALNNYHKSAKIQEKINDPELSITLNNLGIMYKRQGDFEKSLEYYEESLEIRRKSDDKIGMANSYNNIGKLYQDQEESDIALMYYKKALVIREVEGHRKGIANSYSSIAEILFDQGDDEKALEYILKSINLSQDLDGLVSLCGNYYQLGEIYKKRGELNKAEQAAIKSYDLSNELGFPKLISRASRLLSEISELKGNKAAALDYYRVHIEMRDSTVNSESQKMFAQTKARYAYEKQKAIDDNNHRNEILLEQEKHQRQKYITYGVIFGLIMLLIFLIFVFNRLRVITRQKRQITAQNAELEHKRREILDSIAYAKRIQSAILPNEQVVQKLLGESFILYKPKDIVAGDFYWVHCTDDNKVLFAAADCTGHGVPGAMVSVVCNNGLNRSVRESGLTDPGEILNRTREIVTEELAKSGEQVADGMDIAMCKLDGRTLWYSGAYNPLWLVRKGELIVYKGAKQPIGVFTCQVPFETEKIDLEKGDTLYIFSDGYVDQFGGPKRKKFKSKAFEELILSLQNLDMNMQVSKLDDAFENWRGDNEQLDDVCVIGVRIQ